jgi:hypothetical protein
VLPPPPLQDSAADRDDVAAVAQDVAWIRGRIVGLVAIGTLLGTIAGGVVVGVLVAVLTHAR